MRIPEKQKDYFHFLPSGDRATLKDEQTKLYIKAGNALYWVEVDRGIIKNAADGIKKCDFLCYTDTERNTHLIELKGAYTQAAPKQISATLKHIKDDSDLSFLVNNVQLLDAYIVSPGRQEIPRGVDDIKRQITKELAKHCKTRVSNLDTLLKFVKVVPKLKTLSEKNGQIICSNDAPIVF